MKFLSGPFKAVAYAGKNFGGGSYRDRGSGLVGGPGADPPDAGELSKICKRFLKKIAKNAIFSPIFSKNFKTMRSTFASLDEKHNCLGNSEKILKISDENSMEKLHFSLFSWKICC